MEALRHRRIAISVEARVAREKDVKSNRILPSRPRRIPRLVLAKFIHWSVSEQYAVGVLANRTCAGRLRGGTCVEVVANYGSRHCRKTHARIRIQSYEQHSHEHGGAKKTRTNMAEQGKIFMNYNHRTSQSRSAHAAIRTSAHRTVSPGSPAPRPNSYQLHHQCTPNHPVQPQGWRQPPLITQMRHLGRFYSRLQPATNE